tara:strand:- start:1112 stop:1405 length:294 start_codon:yes stop_codon:yes gene_type:complete
MENFLYGVLTNTGKGFFTAEDRKNFFLRGYPADVWVIGNNERGACWVADRNGVFKTKSEAQALVDANVQAAQTAWDALSDEEKARPGNERPSDVTIP